VKFVAENIRYLLALATLGEAKQMDAEPKVAKASKAKHSCITSLQTFSW
jgi:hypothetical protein